MSIFEDEVQVVGTILDDSRGSLPFALLHGEALVACASWGLGDAGVQAVHLDEAGWDELVHSGLGLVLHDSLCPLTPGGFIADAVALALEHDVVVAGVRPVTDSVKIVADGFVEGDVERDELLVVTSPVVLPASVLATMTTPPGSDLVAILERLAAEGREVRTLVAPSSGRRVGSLEDVAVLEALSSPDSAD